MKKKVWDHALGVLLPGANKILLKMKLTLCIILFSFLGAMATDLYSQTTKLSLDLKNTTVKEVLGAIETQSEFFFLYSEKIIDVNRNVNIEVYGSTIEKILDKIFAGTNVNYAVKGRQIVLTTPEANNFLGYFSAQQQKSISGKVTDSSGGSLPGVSVVVKGTTNGTITDADGNYHLTNVPDNAILQFSFVGMKTKEESVIGKTTIDASLLEETVSIDEVVAVAYGKSLKSTLTSSISTVKSSSLVDAPTANISNKLAGRMAGVLTYQTSGEAGLDATTMRIRGRNTMGNADPLVIIDGIKGDMNSINSNDIENISVLKDASAVAPYGLAAANGVILITTKKGLKESAKFSYSANFGIQNPVYLTKTINSYQQALMRNEIYLNDHNGDTNVPFSDAVLEEYRKVCSGDPNGNYDKYFNSHNLRDVIRHDAPISNHSVSVRGGSQTVSYYAGLEYLNQQSMLPNENYEKYSGILNLDTDINETLKIMLSVKMGENQRKWPSFNGEVMNNFGIYERCYEISPDEPIWYPNTDGLWANGGFGFNPIGRIYTSGISKNKTFNNTYTLGFEKKLPIKGLSIKGNFNYENINQFGEAWNQEPIYWVVDNTVSPAVYTKRESTAKPNFTESVYKGSNITAQGYITYNNTFGKHEVDGLFVSEVSDAQNSTFSAGRKNYSVLIHTLDMGSSVQSDLSNSGTASAARSTGLVTKLGYKFDNKYLIDFSGRLDQHYYFAPGHRAGFFPAVSVGWRMGQEKFIKERFSWINEFKIRGSWGKSGNLAGGPFQYMNSYSSTADVYRLGGQLVQGLTELSPANTSITWEKQGQTDIGIDFDLWNGLLTFSGDYFYQIRNNMLLNPDVLLPAEYGIGLPQENAGRMSNKGIEFTVGSRHNLDNGIIFDVNANLTFARNKLLEIFENPATYNDPNRRLTGRPMGAQFGLVALGFFQNEAEVKNSPKQDFGYYTVGDVKYEDVNKDGKIDATDQKMIGHGNFPECTFGLNFGAKWKGFDASVLFQGATSVNVNLPGAAGGGAPGQSNGNTQIEGLNHWTPETPNAKFPRWSYRSLSNNFQTSTLTMRDGTYFRLKNFSIGYTIPAELLKKIKIGSLRVYCSGQNMLTWTSEFLNSDPESAAGGRYRFANQKAMSIGFDLTF